MLTENDLIEYDLIEYDKLDQRFTTTDKGFQFQERYEDLNKLMGAIPTKQQQKKTKERK